MLFLSPSFEFKTPFDSPLEPQPEFTYYSKIQQSDLVPTISTVLGLPVPLNNLGVTLNLLFPLWKSLSPRTVLTKPTNSDWLSLEAIYCKSLGW
jgi:ethanolamine phosphate transferase 2 subunit G